MPRPSSPVAVVVTNHRGGKCLIQHVAQVDPMSRLTRKLAQVDAKAPSGLSSGLRHRHQRQTQQTDPSGVKTERGQAKVGLVLPHFFFAHDGHRLGPAATQVRPY
jgi:hypothetical protein